MAYQTPQGYFDHNAHMQPPQQQDLVGYGSHESFYEQYSNPSGYYEGDDGRSMHTTESHAPLVYHTPGNYPPMPRNSPPRQASYGGPPSPPRLQQSQSSYAAGSPYSEKSYHQQYSPGPRSQQSPGGNYLPFSDTAYGHVHEKVMRRRSVKQVQLQQGNLVLDCPVPTSILQYAKQYPGAGEKEFTHMRYQAVTCDPDDFTRARYMLRPTMWQRKTEMAIVMTMYNETPDLFHRSWSSVVKNLIHLNSRDRSKTWGKDSWKKIVVVIVSDGRKKIDHKTQEMIGVLGAFQAGVMKDTVVDKPVQAHMFEYTTQVTTDDLGNVQGGICPIQVIFVLKENNKKKLNSHRWFFNAVCAQLNPNVCMLIDVGTKPSGTSLYSLYKTFEKHSNVGGAAGEICVETGRGCSALIQPLVAAQNFEYKMSNILDKPTESVFGYISVLPGAFSAYRYKALQGAPLQAYFAGERMHEPGATAGVFESNQYLAEDRILCWEIVTSSKANWVLRYVKSAKASTDVPTTIDEFIGQRRRWNNGAFFAALHATLHFWKIWSSGHNFFRKIWLTIEALYGFIQLIFSVTMLANFFLSIVFVCNAATSVPNNDPFGGQGTRVVSILQQGWIAALIVVLVCSLGNRPRGSRFAYSAVAFWFAVCFGIALYCGAWTIYLVFKEVPRGLTFIQTLKSIFETTAFRDIVISLASTYALYLVSSLLHFEPWHMLTSFLQYMLFLPFFVNVLSIYSFCNTHDISWGTKGAASVSTDLGAAKTTGKEAVEVALPTEPEDINQLWMAMRKDLSVKTTAAPDKRDLETKTRDHYANYRTNALLLYLGINIAIVLVFNSAFFIDLVQKDTGTKVTTNPYMSFIFWSVAGISAFRFLGSTLYLILRLFGH